MNQHVQEQISALIDDELDSDALDALLAAAATQPEVKAQIGRYALLGDLMLRQMPPRLDNAVADGVAAALDNEPSHVPRLAPQPVSGADRRRARQASRDRVATRARRTRWQRRWLSPAPGLALAATVAAVAVLVWPMFGSDDARVDVATTQPALAPPSAVLPVSPVGSSWGDAQQGLIPAGAAPQSPTTAASVQWDRLDPHVQQHLQGYAVFHGSEAVGQQLPIMPPTVRLTRQDIDVP